MDVDSKSELTELTAITSNSKMQGRTYMHKGILKDHFCNSVIIRVPAIFAMFTTIFMISAFSTNELSTYNVDENDDLFLYKCKINNRERCLFDDQFCTNNSYNNLCSDDPDMCKAKQAVEMWFIASIVGITLSCLSLIGVCLCAKWKLTVICLYFMTTIACIIGVVGFVDKNDGSGCWNLDNANLQLGVSNILVIVAVCSMFIGTVCLCFWLCCCAVFYTNHHSISYYEL
eukprot:179123_1